MCLSRPAEVLEADGCLAVVRWGDQTIAVNTAPLGEVNPGEYVLVHAGLAIDKVSAADAAGLEALLDEIGRAGATSLAAYDDTSERMPPQAALAGNLLEGATP